MFRKPVFSVVIVSTYLLVYCALFVAGLQNAVSVMFSFSPVLVVWMALTILRHGKYDGAELQENEEWGYADKPRQEL